MIRIFISSTFSDLQTHRESVARAIELVGHYPERMELFLAQPRTPLEVCLREIENCDLFVGMYARRYGFTPEGYSLSMIELEFNHAHENGIPIFAFFLDSSYDWPDEYCDEGEAAQALSNFKDRIDSLYTRTTFTADADLATKVLASLWNHLREDYASNQTAEEIEDAEDSNDLEVEETQLIQMGPLSAQQKHFVEEIVLKLADEKIVGPIKKRYWKRNRHETAFFVKKHYEKVTKSFLDNCSIHCDSTTLDLNRYRLDALAIRAFGMLLNTLLQRVRTNPTPIRITLEIDPFLVWPHGSEPEGFEKGMLREYTSEYLRIDISDRDFEAYENSELMDFEEFNQWSIQEFGYSTFGWQRAIKVIRLLTAMSKRRLNLLGTGDDLVSTHVILSLLSLESIAKLRKMIT